MSITTAGNGENIPQTGAGKVSLSSSSSSLGQSHPTAGKAWQPSHFTPLALSTEVMIYRYRQTDRHFIIIYTRPKPAYGRQGLAGLWGQDTDEVTTFLVFLTSHFAPAALSSDLTNLGPLMTMKIHLETLKNHGNQPKTMKNHETTLKNHGNQAKTMRPP